MGKVLITVGSVTTASRLEKYLRKKKGIKASLMHTPVEINNGGCSYSIRIDAANLSRVKEAIKEIDVAVRKFYMEDYYEGEKKYHVIS